MHKNFFARHALLVLAVVFFFVPFALRGSRYAVQRMKNDVKDWLPADFPETADLEWFKARFMGEQFIVASWDGCSGESDDEAFRRFVDNLLPVQPPSARQAAAAVAADQLAASSDFDEDLGLYARSFQAGEDFEEFIGNRLNLRSGDEQFRNWAGLDEKWIRSGRNEWVYITPDGELYQWTGNRTWPMQAWRAIQQSLGRHEIESDFVAALGPVDGPWYYEDPSRLNARLFKSVETGPSMLSELTTGNADVLPIPVGRARDRLRGVLFGPDDRQTCIVVKLTEAAKQDPRGLVGRGMLGQARGALLDVADASGVQPPEPPPAVPQFIAQLFPADAAVDERPMLRLGGPPVDNAAIDEEGQITLVRLLGLSLAVGLGLSWLCFRSIKITLMVFLVGGISAVTSVGIVYWSGSQLDAVLMSMPSLVYVLGISGAVHVVNYYRESVAESGMASAPDKSVRLGIWPCTMAAFTTSLGLISLASSNIIPIQKFGTFSAVGVIATLILLFTFLPAALEMWPPRRYILRAAGSDSERGPESAIERFLDQFWQAVGRFVLGNYQLVAVLCLIVLSLGAYGLTKIETSVELLKLFDKDAKIIGDYRWLEQNLGKLVPMELVVRVAPDRCMTMDQLADDTIPKTGLEMSLLQRMEIAKAVGDKIDDIFGAEGREDMSPPMLASTFVPHKPTGQSRLAARLVGPYVRRLEKAVPSLKESDFLAIDPDDQHELWRISLRLAALNGIDFGQFVETVQQVVEPIMLAYQYRDTLLACLPGMETGSDAAQPVRVFYFGWAPETETPPTEPGADPVINQTDIFGTYLNGLLAEAGIASRQLGSADDIASLTGNDFALVFNDVQGADLAAIDATPAKCIDARDHVFRPGPDRTAWQRKRPVSVIYTGLVPIVYKAQRTLLASLFESTGMAFVMIAVVMILLLRSPRAGLLSMLPNVFPVVVVFGVMGWWEMLVDIGSMMTASVAMGVAVDDTIHFLSWFRKGLDAGSDRREAILLAYRRVATAMTQTTAIGGVGLSIFAFSTFTPTQRFGALMLAMLATALIGDLLFLPALLASPLGKVFDKIKKPAAAPHPATAGPHTHLSRNAAPAPASAEMPSGLRHEESG